MAILNRADSARLFMGAGGPSGSAAPDRSVVEPGGPATEAPAEMTLRQAYDKLVAVSMDATKLGSALGLVAWDESTLMPPHGADYHAKVQAYLADQANQLLTSPEFGQWLSAAEKGQDWSQVEAINLRLWRHDYDKRTKLPPGFVAREAEMASQSQTAWTKARAENNFAIFRPYLEAMVDLARQKARYYGYEVHPLDALMDDLMPGMTVAQCDRLLGAVTPAIVELVRKIKDSKTVIPDNLFGQAVFPKEKQEALAREMTAAIGLDYQGALYMETPRHPMTTTINPGDVRITTRYKENNPLEPALLAALHEAGHAIYSQGIPAEYYGLPVEQDAGMDIQEASSRYFENYIGRSKPFWQYWFPRFQEVFGPTAATISLDDLYRFMNRFNLSVIRLEADEVSYVLHIIIRYEIERDLFGDKIKTEDLPAVWNQKYKDYLGLDVPDDRSGILQDIHWAGGAFGYFPSYAFGSMNAAQLDAALHRDHPDLDQRLASGDFAVPIAWMREHIYKYGRLYPVTELIKLATGEEQDPSYFIRYLTAKYGEIYQL